MKSLFRILCRVTLCVWFINCSNTPPEAFDSVLIVKENSPETGRFNVTDPDSSKLKYTIVQNGKLGTAAVNPVDGSFTYTPNPDTIGDDIFRFQVNDTELYSKPASVFVSINANGLGILDPGFGNGGMVLDDNAAGGSSSDIGYKVAIDANGRILVAGQSYNINGDSDMALWRFRSDGSLDNEFAGNGIVIEHNTVGGNTTDIGRSVTVDQNGKILVTGYSNYSSTDIDMVVWRYNEDGSLDSGFNDNGYYHSQWTNVDWGYDIVVNSNNKIVVSGMSQFENDYKMALWRLNEDGSLDADFGDGGYVLTPVEGSFIVNGSNIAIDAHNRILVAGVGALSFSNCRIIIFRFNEDGTLDTTFNESGMVIHEYLQPWIFQIALPDIALDHNEKIVVSGVILRTNPETDGPDLDLGIWRYNENGSLDQSFNKVGFVNHHNAAGGNGNDIAYSMVIDDNNSILVSGVSASDSNNDMVIWRYTEDGALDSRFNSGQGFVLDSTETTDQIAFQYGFSIVLDEHQRIVVAGSSNTQNNNMNMAVWRYK